MEKIKINETVIIFIITSFAYFICYGFELGYAKEIGFSIYFISVDLLNFVLLGGFFLFIFYYIVSINIFLINGKLRHYLIGLVIANSVILILYYLGPDTNPLLKLFYVKILLAISNLILFTTFLFKRVKFTRLSLIISTIFLPIFLFSLAFEFGAGYAEIDYATRDKLNSIEYNGNKYGILKVYSGNIVALNLDNNQKREILYIPKEQVNVITVNKVNPI